MTTLLRAPKGFVGLQVGIAAVLAACSGGKTDSRTGPGAGGAGGTTTIGITIPTNGSGGSANSGSSIPGYTLAVSPDADQTLTVTEANPNPTLTFTATLNGKPVNAGYSIDRGDIGTVPQVTGPTGVFTASGAAAGTATVTISVSVGTATLVIKRQVVVKINAQQNGPRRDSSNAIVPAEQAQLSPDITTSIDGGVLPAGGSGAIKLNLGGGVGGVGGEGLGEAVTDPAILSALNQASPDAGTGGLTFLYPYDQTVWPRGILAPLLMWSWAAGDADAIQISLTNASGTFAWKGSFAPPKVLSQMSPTGKFIRHPIPQDVWDQATSSAGNALPDGTSNSLTVSLTVVKGGQVAGPITEKWIVAPARLSGVIYYQSYGTWLAANSGSDVAQATNPITADKRFGAGVLSIHVGETKPVLVSSSKECQVCHSAASDGSRLVVVRDTGTRSSVAVYDLASSGTSAEANPVPVAADSFSAVAPDGTSLLTVDGALRALPYQGPDAGSDLPLTKPQGLPTNLGAPSFSSDGTLLSFNAASTKLAIAPFAFGPTNTIGAPVLVADVSSESGKQVGWPAFFPTNQAIVFEKQTRAGTDGFLGSLATRKGAKGQIAWTNTTDTSQVTMLNKLNGLNPDGTSYLPKLSNAVPLSCTADGTRVDGAGTGGLAATAADPTHNDDVDLNYEPTVNPVATGGYAWVVFTSRRLYGNVATIPPYCSDPRGADLVNNITTKKLWVAAIDVNGKPGTDPSHPAFYLPAQELLAGNARGYWVLDPCRPDGDSCSTGDQCCNGFCQPNGAGGALVCSNKTVTVTCAQTQEKCTTTADCCDQDNNSCVGNFCVQNTITPPL